MDDRKKLIPKIEGYMRIPIWAGMLLFVMVLLLFAQNKDGGLIGICFVLLYFTIIVLFYIKTRPRLISDMMTFALEQGQAQHQLLKKLGLPYVLTDLEGQILWYNDPFYEMMKEKEGKNKKKIQQLFEEMKKENFPTKENPKKKMNVHCEKGDYSVEILRVCVDELLEGVEQTRQLEDVNTMLAFYFHDETLLRKVMKQNEDQKLVAGLIYIDNYEEVLESIEEVRQSLLVALIDRKINKYMQNLNAICKKIEKDKFFVVFQQEYLKQLEQSKFSILDEIRSINIGNEMAVTLSISLGVNSPTYFQAYENARVAMDLALGRGGDQAVVKDGEKISYYGGKTQGVEKNTRVKARVKAHAFKEIMETMDEVVIMGHRYPDVDSIGAAIGIYRLAKMLNKKAHIVINDVTISIRPVLNNFIGNEAYEEDMFVDTTRAISLMKPSTLLVVVDVNRPSYTEGPELLPIAKNVVVFDHHRQTNEIIEQAVLSYIEPYASSSCEMVAEILQYFPDGPRLRPIEADAMYAGMLIDTDNFVTKTGVRTFEAAAFLRRSGADVVRVRKMFRNSMDSYKLRAEVIRGAEVYYEHFAISIMPSEGVDSPNVLAAQAANELLDIEGIRASFVMTKIGNQVFISARSIDDVNVQIIMEKLGGGGHLNIAGAQLKDVTEEETVVLLKEILKIMIEEGEI